MSDMRRSTTYKRVCKLQKCRIYPKSLVKRIGEWCGNRKNMKCAQITFYCGAELFKASYISKQLFNALYAAFGSCVHGALKVAALLFSELDPEAIKPATPKVLAIDGF